MKILTVDDSTTMRRIIAHHLDSAGFSEVLEASNGQEALNLIHQVDLVLLDWNMPVMDGLSFVKEVRADPRLKSIPIIMVTSESGKAEVLEALKNGVNDYIVKPFTPQILLAKVKSLVK